MMKKFISILLCVAALFGLAACGVPRPGTVLRKLEPYLPADAWGHFSQFDKEILENGDTLYDWHEPITEGGEETAQKIECVFSKDGLTHYVYKNYFFQLSEPGEPLTMDGAASMAKNFARDFLPGGEKMVLKNVPGANPHIYDPGMVESWVGTQGGKTYTISIELHIGYVLELIVE